MATKRKTPAPAQEQTGLRTRIVTEPAQEHPGLRTRIVTEPPPPDAKRFDFFLIDTEWNKPVSKLLRELLPQFVQYHNRDDLYILSREQSVEILKREPKLIGHDPTIIVYDLFHPDTRKAYRYRGFRLNLGLFKNAEQALARLQEFVRFLITHRCAVSLETEVRRELHREGLQGMVKVLRETATELL
jgi:hypothetical protein